MSTHNKPVHDKIRKLPKNAPKYFFLFSSFFFFFFFFFFFGGGVGGGGGDELPRGSKTSSNQPR